MKHLKVFEDLFELQQNDFDCATIYLEDIQPVTTDEGFITAEYENVSNHILVYFEFKDWTEEDSYDKFYNFLKKHKLKIKNEYFSEDLYKKYIIVVMVTLYKVKKYAEIYKTLNKYNL